MARLRDQLNPGGPDAEPHGGHIIAYQEFTEKAPNYVWAEQLWNWLLGTGADWCLQLQDDVTVPTFFFPALEAMLHNLPPEAAIIGLSATHPLSSEIARQGHRWFVTDGMLIGWAYVLRREALRVFMENRARADEAFRHQSEDVQLGQFARAANLKVWHPVPTLCDHDQTIISSYKGNELHSHRRPAVTWRDFGEGSMCDPTWWTPPHLSAVQNLPMPSQKLCWWCGKRQAKISSGETGAGICGTCLGICFGTFLGRDDRDG